MKIKQAIREYIHLILQHPKLFNDTMLFNLWLGKDYSDEKLKESLDIAQLDDIIKALLSKDESYFSSIT